MPPIAPGFTPLERAVLEAVCDNYSADREMLHAQLATATVRSRENTGGGFFTHFAVDRSTKAVGNAADPRNGPAAKIDRLEGWLGFILWINDEGYADCLEGYGMGGPTHEIDLETAGFELVPLPYDPLSSNAS